MGFALMLAGYVLEVASRLLSRWFRFPGAASWATVRSPAPDLRYSILYPSILLPLPLGSFQVTMRLVSPALLTGGLFRPVWAEVVGSAEVGPEVVSLLAAAPDPDLVLVLPGWGYHGWGACDLGDQPRVVIARAVLRLIILDGERYLLPVRVGCGVVGSTRPGCSARIPAGTGP